MGVKATIGPDYVHNEISGDRPSVARTVGVMGSTSGNIDNTTKL